MDYDNDPLVKSIGSRIGDQKAWKKYIRNFNSMLLSLQPYSFPNVTYRVFVQLLEHIERSNKQIFAQFGIKFQLCIIRIRTKDVSIRNENESDFTETSFTMRQEVLEDLYRIELPYIKR